MQQHGGREEGGRCLLLGGACCWVTLLRGGHLYVPCCMAMPSNSHVGTSADCCMYGCTSRWLRVQAIAWQQLPQTYAASWNVSVSASSAAALLRNEPQHIQHTCTVYVAGGDTFAG